MRGLGENVRIVSDKRCKEGQDVQLDGLGDTVIGGSGDDGGVVGENLGQVTIGGCMERDRVVIRWDGQQVTVLMRDMDEFYQLLTTTMEKVREGEASLLKRRDVIVYPGEATDAG